MIPSLASLSVFRGIVATLVLLGSLALPRPALPLGEEAFGNQPVGVQPEWPTGILPVVNDSHRVYRSWVNGNENFWFSGDAKALNEALARFAEVALDVREVVILPIPGETRSFERKPVTFQWRVAVPSGIYLAMALRETDANVHLRKATFFVHVAGDLRIADLVVPEALTVLDAGDLVLRAKRGLSAKDQGTRGGAAMLLDEVAWEEGAVELLEKALGDSEEYVRTCAAGALERCGHSASSALPALEKLSADPEARVREAAASASKAIRAAAAPPEKEAAGLARTQAEIRKLRDGRRRK